MNIHRIYMLRCIEIAKKGLGTTAPNPMVGAVVVNNNMIVGEGYTSAYGGPHAEVNAINAVKDKGLLKKATLYVTLEPCCHYGKTPPCTDLIIKNKIPRVVVGLIDPNEKVAGQGIQKLRKAGVEVITGVLETECREHHKRFLTFIEKRRPYTILKWAETEDGFIAPEKDKRSKKPTPFWITNPHSRQLVHKWRSEEQAILVGTNTVLEDNPKLDVRQWTGKNPLRIIVDKRLKIKANYHVLDGSSPTIILTEVEDVSQHIEGVDYAIIDFSNNLVNQIFEVCQKNNIISILVEGGTKTLNSFIVEKEWDEARVFIGQTSFQTGLKAPMLSGNLTKTRNIGNDLLKIYSND
ncbi:MAG: bifunctional diaminohydroxyphosphoribosylaminopyrimidine deaminase/5-amino-6-(5-phosphoribosylamino)uracil reductase RibD [Pricia sp.]|nr:bifunctional diaminohydroxyphosphoribosylaminopyrimidine deaminase/5-amino-6-(5-phosphoribosylamino)uracil reductase RibD [Pricia sp.]